MPKVVIEVPTVLGPDSPIIFNSSEVIAMELLDWPWVAEGLKEVLLSRI